MRGYAKCTSVTLFFQQNPRGLLFWARHQRLTGGGGCGTLRPRGHCGCNWFGPVFFAWFLLAVFHLQARGKQTKRIQTCMRGRAISFKGVGEPYYHQERDTRVLLLSGQPLESIEESFRLGDPSNAGSSLDNKPTGSTPTEISPHLSWSSEDPSQLSSLSSS